MYVKFDHNRVCILKLKKKSSVYYSAQPHNWLYLRKVHYGKLFSPFFSIIPKIILPKWKYWSQIYLQIICLHGHVLWAINQRLYVHVLSCKAKCRSCRLLMCIINIWCKCRCIVLIVNKEMLIIYFKKTHRHNAIKHD